MQEEIGKIAGVIWDALNTRGTVPQRAEESGKREGTHLRLGYWMAGARKPDCDHAREALLPNPLETRARKGDGRLVG